jgi:triosephosphate isomerase
MRRHIIAGNWKMNMLIQDAVALATGVAQHTRELGGVELVVTPAMLAVTPVAHALKEAGYTHVGVAAQNMHTVATKGAFTGEVSAQMLKDAGCGYVIIGHSERRQFFGETDAGVNYKAKVALKNALIPIVCLGETLSEREDERTMDRVEFQVRAALAGISAHDVSRLVLAYEPIWAIGTGKTASPEQAQEVHAFIRGVLTDLHGEETAQQVRIQYGGSVKPANIADLISQPDIDGALVGGASLKVSDFVALAVASNA